MKKIILGSLGAVLIASAANASEHGFILSTGAEIFGSAEIKTKVEGFSPETEKSTDINGSGGFSLGYGNNKVMGAVSFSRSSDDLTSMNEFSVGGSFAFTNDTVTPYVSASVGIVSLNIDEDVFGEEISATGFTYGIGVGVQYNMTDKTNLKVGLVYSGLSLSDEVYGYDVDVTGSNIGLVTSISVRF
ncbi:MAG: porin family protein [Rickettsiales bacterium]|jgi:opacity protein-like surface antigen|nr:porin family protein [Rickettsiales bacterium]